MVIATKKEALLTGLRNNERGLTAAQIANWYGVSNVTATVSDLRMDGFAIYANRTIDTKGRVKTFFRLGTPSRAVVSAGYKALALGL